jgi:hypothetical protein
MADRDIRVTSAIQTYQRRLNAKPYVPSTTFGRATLGANGVANKLFIASLFRARNMATLPSIPGRYYCKVIAIVHPFLLAELLFGNRN